MLIFVETKNPMTIVYIDRRTDGKLEKVLESKYSDLAEVAAEAITNHCRFKTVVVREAGQAATCFVYGKKMIDGAMRSDVDSSLAMAMGVVEEKK